MTHDKITQTEKKHREQIRFRVFEGTFSIQQLCLIYNACVILREPKRLKDDNLGLIAFSL